MADYRAKVEEYMRLELNMSDLYSLYQKLFPEDRDFWEKMVEEELRHARIIEMLLGLPDKLPDNLLDPNHESMVEANKNVVETINCYKKNPPSRKEAYQKAIYFENSAGELHYTNVLSLPKESQELESFRKLNQCDKSHCQEIQKLLG